MTRDKGPCQECLETYGIENYKTQLHHIVFRSECKQLEHCKLNFVYLCLKHHQDHREGVHHNLKLNRKYKLRFQNQLEILWDKQYLTREEINEVLQISDKALNRLLKTLTLQKDRYVREEVIRQCMGGRMIIE